jgi:thioredoxin reductase (NADPH)
VKDDSHPASSAGPPQPDRTGAYPTLDGSELAVLEALGTRRTTAVSEYLFREGDASVDFYVILSGAVDVAVHGEGDERILVRHGPGQFAGELNLLTGQRAYVSARVVEDGEVLVLPVATLREILGNRPGLGDKILASFLARRSNLLRGAAAAVRLVGSRFSPASMRLREFLARNRVPHEWMDAERDEQVESLLRESAVAPADLPVVITAGAVIRRATPAAVARQLGLSVAAPVERSFDLVIVGGGPAGLAAAVYASSEGLGTVVVESVAVGGQAGTSSRIENYFGFPAGISGSDLTERAVVQAEKFGARTMCPAAATALKEDGGHLVIRLADGTELTSRAVIVATGARYRRLDAVGLADFEGSGVYYAATELEARLCAGSSVVVVGGGNSAGQASLFLAETVGEVTLVVRREDLGTTMSRYLVDRIEAERHIRVRTSTQVTALIGDLALRSVQLTGAHEIEDLPCAALFSFIGADPAGGWLSGCAALDDGGFVLTDRSLAAEQLDGRWMALARQPLPFETSHPGLFAVGDVRAGSIKRVAAAVGEGSAAVRAVHEYLAFAH